MKKNLKLSIKILLYSFLNPGGGIILSFLSLFPNIKKENNIRGIILSILGIIVGIILLVSPFSLIIGLFLSKLCNKMITLLPLKILFIFLGIFGMFISFITSVINKNTILDANMKKINPFDIIYRTQNEINVLYSKFGIVSTIRFILNMIVPGVGTFTLLCKYGCNLGILKVSFIQFILGFICLISEILIIFQNDFQNWNLGGDIYISIMGIASSFTDNGLLILNYLFTVSLCFYFSGLVLIILCDYLEDTDFPDKKISGLFFIFLNILTGGLGISFLTLNFI